MNTVRFKMTIHRDKGKYVINSPGSHAQRRPLVFTNLNRAMARFEYLCALHGQ